MHREVRVPLLLVRIIPELRNQRPTRPVPIHHHLKRIVMQPRIRKIPEVVISLIQKIQPVQPLHPPHLHMHIQILRIRRGMLLLIIMHLIEPNRVALRHHRPVTRIAIDPRNLIRRKLKHLNICAGGGAVSFCSTRFTSGGVTGRICCAHKPAPLASTITPAQRIITCRPS